MSSKEYERFHTAKACLDRLAEEGAAFSRLDAAMAELSGFLLTGASDEVRGTVEKFGLRYNRLMQQAKQANEAAVVELNAEDSQELLQGLEETCQLVCSSESELVLSKLREIGDELPEEELLLIRQYPAWFLPLLLQQFIADVETLERWEGKPVERLASKSVSTLGQFICCIASELNAAEFVPVVLRGLMLPGELPLALFEDTINDEVSRFLGHFLANDIERVDSIVLNPNGNTFARWCAVVAYKYFVRDGVLTLPEAVERLVHLFEATKISAEDDETPALEHDSMLSAGIVETIGAIGGAGLSKIGDSEQQWDYIDESVIFREEFVGQAAPTPPETLTYDLRVLPPTRVEDCILEFRNWVCFSDEDDEDDFEEDFEEGDFDDEGVDLGDEVAWSLPEAPVRATKAANTPRNAQCPCGSGKKYKKCCMLADRS